MQLSVSGQMLPVDAIIQVDINGTPVDFSLSASFYNKSSNAWNTKVDATTGIVTLLAPNPLRKGAPSIFYDGAAVLYLLMGSNSDPAIDNYTIKLGAGYDTYFEPPLQNYTGPIKGKWSNAIGAAQVTEYM